MLAPDLDSAVARLQEMVDAARTIVPFTGAGISTECGIPDFRSPGGIWTKNRPIPFEQFLASQRHIVRNTDEANVPAGPAGTDCLMHGFLHAG